MGAVTTDQDPSRGGLEPILRPRSIALIGASRQPNTVGGNVLANLIQCGFNGPVWPVNPNATEIQGRRTYRSVSDLPSNADLAVIAVPGRAVPGVVAECVNHGVRGLVVLSAGFSEVGPDGSALQAELLRLVRSHGIRMVGPNCLGVLNTEPGYQLNATFAPTWPPAGGVSLASQSGAVGLALLDSAREFGIGVRHFVSMGNKADVSGNDLLEFWEHDPGTTVIALYLESLGNPRRFMEIARRVSRQKPIIVVKSGRTQAGARAASSHTGALAGMDIAADALFGQAGVIRTATISEMFDLAELLANQPLPHGRRLAILTNAGGPAIMAADSAEGHGLRVQQLSAATMAALRGVLPREASVTNPVDMIAGAGPREYEHCVRVLAADPDVDALLVQFIPPMGVAATEVAQAIMRGAASATKPILTSILGSHGVPEALALLRDHRFPAFQFPEAAVAALARAVTRSEWLAAPVGQPAELADVDAEAARAVLAPHPAGWLPPEAVRALLLAYGIAMPPSLNADSEADAVAAAESLSYPVALKLRSATVQHKSDVGGVELNLPDAASVRAAWQRIRGNLERRGMLPAFGGVTVQPMVRGGVETIVGMTTAPRFGALLAFGIGGTAVEVWKDVVFRVSPLRDTDAREMVESIRGRVLLEGFRGGPRMDKQALADVVLRVDRLVRDHPRILELDLNPLLAFPAGTAPLALDARIRVGEATAA